MTTARELLEQADALMRRQRETSDDDVPLLTDVVGSTPVPDAEPIGTTDDDVPTLTDAVTATEKAEAARFGSEAETLPAPKPLDEWIPGLPSADAVVLRAGPAGGGSPAAPTGGGAPARDAARGATRSEGSASPPESAPRSGEVPWRALHEQLYASVIQRVDLFTESALRARLAEEIRPIVERAGEALVERIGDELGRLIRAYVAEAVDREIEEARRALARARLD